MCGFSHDVCVRKNLCPPGPARASERGAREQFYFFAADVFLAAFDLGVAAAAFFGLGAFGFLVGGLAVFLAALLPFDGVEALLVAFAAGFFFAAAAFLSLVAAATLGFAADAATFFLAAALGLPFAAAAFAFAAADRAEAAAADDEEARDVDFATIFFDLDVLADLDAPPFDSSLNDPEAPLPFVWMSAPDSTALFKYFLMKGASFSASTLYEAAMYFLIACREEPLRSFSSMMALFTISEVLGCVGFALGFLAAAAAAAAPFCFFAGVAGAGTSEATAVSAIIRMRDET